MNSPTLPRERQRPSMLQLQLVKVVKENRGEAFVLSHLQSGADFSCWLELGDPSS